MAKKRIPSFGISFSWKRAVGISQAKQKFSRATGIPLSRSGRQRKIGKMAGCCVAIAPIIGILILLALR